MKFPTGGIVRERENAGAQAQDLVKFQDRQYSLDGRRRIGILTNIIVNYIISYNLLNLTPERHSLQVLLFFRRYLK